MKSVLWDSASATLKAPEEKKVIKLELSKRKQIENMYDELMNEIFETVCEDLCKYADEEGEQSRWEAHCKDCELWRLL